jgi:flagellar biosynthetic protein FliR
MTGAVSSLQAWLVATLLLSLRIGPVFAAAPPFTLVRMPRLFRLLLAIGLSAAMTSFKPLDPALPGLALAALVPAAARELLLGIVFVVAFQAAFGAIYLAGRTIDVQAGFGLAMLVDPGSGARTPLTGSLFAFLAGLAFFEMGGQNDLLRIIAASLDSLPLGAPHPIASLPALFAFLSIVFLTAMGAAGGVVLALFLADMAIAMLSRTVPQMNVLVLGFQVKTLLLLAALPLTLGLSGLLLARMMRITLEALPGLL